MTTAVGTQPNSALEPSLGPREAPSEPIASEIQVVSLDRHILVNHEEDGSHFLPRYKAVVREAAEAVKARKGLIFVEGPLGCGKSTLVECLADELAIPKFVEDVEDAEVKRYLSMLYSDQEVVRRVGAVGINNRYLTMRMRQYEQALVIAQSAVIDRTLVGDDIYMEGFVESNLMTEAQVEDIRRRRAAEISILRPTTLRTAPLEVAIMITGPAEVFYARKNRRARGVEVEDSGKGVSLEYMRSLTERYRKLPSLLARSGFRGPVLQVGQVIRDGVYFDPASGRHLLPILEFIRDYFRRS